MPTTPPSKRRFWSIIGGGDKKTLAAEPNALMPWLTECQHHDAVPDVIRRPWCRRLTRINLYL